MQKRENGGPSYIITSNSLVATAIEEAFNPLQTGDCYQHVYTDNSP